MLHLTGYGEVIGVVAQQAPATKLGHEPHAIGQVRQVDFPLPMEAQGVRVLPLIAQAVGVVAQQPRFDARQRRIEVLRCAE
ncbi:hypothetical protein D3C81_1788260 [compost metagenome]